MLASVPAGLIRYTLGVQPGELVETPEVTLINDALRHLENMGTWKCLERRSRPLSFLKGSATVDLSLIPDLLQPIAIVSNSSQLRSIMFVSLAEILRLRSANTFQSNALAYYGAVVHQPDENKNFLGFTEGFDDATWTKSNATATADQAVSPAGESSGIADRLTGTTTAGFVQQTVDPSLLALGEDYIFSVFLKKDTSVEATIEIQQLGAGGATSAIAQRTTQRVAFSASGAASLGAAATSQGAGRHHATVEDIGGGWYRVGIVLTWDSNPAKPSSLLACRIYPATITNGQSVFAFGAQLERSTPLAIDATGGPTRYSANTGAFAVAVATLKRLLEIYPTPDTDQMGTLALFYRATLPLVIDETSQIPLPTYMEPLFYELCRQFARGYNEEDEASLSVRLLEIESSTLFRRAVEQDRNLQFDYGPMQGQAWLQGAEGRELSTNVVSTNVMVTIA